MVVGKSGSGKSVFSDRLAKITGIKVTHLDKEYYNPDWSHAYTKEDFTKHVEKIIQQDKWIIDGNYSRTMDARIKRADTIVFFNTSLLRSLYYVIRRKLFPARYAPDKHAGMKEKVSFTLLKQILTYPTKMVMNKIYKNRDAIVFVVKNHSEADDVLEQIKFRGQEKDPAARRQLG